MVLLKRLDKRDCLKHTNLKIASSRLTMNSDDSSQGEATDSARSAPVVFKTKVIDDDSLKKKEKTTLDALIAKVGKINSCRSQWDEETKKRVLVEPAIYQQSSKARHAEMIYDITNYLLVCCLWDQFLEKLVLETNYKEAVEVVQSMLDLNSSKKATLEAKSALEFWLTAQQFASKRRSSNRQFPRKQIVSSALLVKLTLTQGRSHWC